MDAQLGVLTQRVDNFQREAEGAGIPGFRGLGPIVPLINRIWGLWDLIIIYPKPYSIYLRRTLGFVGEFNVWGA